MNRENFTALRAFDLLLRTSQNANIKLADLAQWVVDEHEKTVTS